MLCEGKKNLSMISASFEIGIFLSGLARYWIKILLLIFFFHISMDMDGCRKGADEYHIMERLKKACI